MPHTPEQEKFQSFLDYFMNDYAEQVKSLFPDLNPREQSNVPIIQSESFFAHCMFRAIVKNYLFDGSDNGLYYTVDIELRDNDILFGNQTYVGKDLNNWTDTAIDEMNTAVFDNPPESFTTATGDIYAFIGGNCEFKLYAGGVYDYSKVRFKMGADGSFFGKLSSNYFMVYLNELTYTIDASNVVHPNKDYSSMNPWGSNGFLSIKNYPIVGNVKDLTTINSFITKMGATNNYTNTYTTPENKTITVYYGDNYIITHVNDDEPVSYNDLQNAVNIAVNQINTDNNTDYIAPDFPSNEDKDHEIEMSVSQFTAGKNGMVYYYSLEQDDVWKVRDGLNTINLDPAVLKDVTRNLISYKLFALSPAALIKTKTPVIVHIGGREIKYNGNSIPADYVEELNSIYLGSIAIPRTYNDYRDFAPYTKIELFVPFCGWTTLPSWCMDKYITGDMYIDIMNGSCKAIIKASQTVVAELGGSCAYDVPFVADATGTKAAALLSKAATTAGAVATGNPMAIITSGISLASAMNANYTEMRGVCGDGSNINGLDRMYVKITRVSYTDEFKPERPDAYKHTYGIPCGKDVTLSQGDGYTQILDANITGNMTAKEKQMIIDGFRHGLIL